MILEIKSSEWIYVVIFENIMLGTDDLTEIAGWCDKFTPQYLFKAWIDENHGNDRYCFLNQEDALLFMLRWSHLDG